MEIKEKTVSAYDANTELLRAFRRGDRAAGDELATLIAPLVFSIASRFRGRGVDFSELVEAGNVGLVKAMNTFDFERGCVFSTYATPLVFGEIRRFIRDDGIIKVSREQKRLCAALAAERERRLSLGERCDIEALAEAVGISVEDAAAAYFASAAPRSLEESASSEDDGRTLADTVCDEGAELRDFETLAVKLAIERLSEFERRIITLRFYRDLSQVEVARIMGLSQVKISREEKKILGRLKKELS
ncbi:MAG: sigma-70 family RNA polymerase sigma factor [Clostridia bacterium]|nr:sigma-70 family RNA polymerase sigma factor [Clostridia bacterium]